MVVDRGVAVRTQHSTCRIVGLKVHEAMSKDRQKTYKYRGRNLTVSFVHFNSVTNGFWSVVNVGPKTPKVRGYSGTQAGECSKSRDCWISS